MDLNEVVLSFALAFLALAALVWAAVRWIAGDRPDFGEACLTTLLMLVFGATGAVLLGLAYRTIRPAGVWIFIGNAPLVGWDVDLDEGLVWTAGLALGYLGALRLTIPGRTSRRILLALLTAVATPALLILCEQAVRTGARLAREAFAHLW